MAQSHDQVVPLNSDDQIKDVLMEANTGGNNKLLVFGVVSDDYKIFCDYMMKPFNKMAKAFEGKARFYKLNLNNCQNFAWAHKLQAYPSFVLMEGGQEVDVVVGARPAELRKAIARHTGGLR